jgi:hypothetical protein
MRSSTATIEAMSSGYDAMLMDRFNGTLPQTLDYEDFFEDFLTAREALFTAA